jgi:hypothetical protein
MWDFSQPHHAVLRKTGISRFSANRPELAAICARLTSYHPCGVEIRPLLVATIKRLPQRTIESTLPTPGTVCPGLALQTPLGPSRTAVPSVTSRSVQPLIVVGLVSGVGVSFVGVGTALAPVEAVCRCVTIDCLLAGGESGDVPRRACGRRAFSLAVGEGTTIAVRGD